MLIEQLIFYVFSIAAVFAGVMVITSRSPVKSALFLVYAFFNVAVLWMLLEAEFLSLVLILVYVGAVMTLFLFVVMMMNIDVAKSRQSFWRYLPFGVLIVAVIVGLLVWAIGPKHFGLAHQAVPAHKGADYSNIKELGSVLYTQYVYPFELASVLLLVAIVAAITLAFRGRKNRKSQVPAEQIRIRPEDRMRIVKMKSE